MAEFRRSIALPQLEARRSCRENTCYRPHAHDTFSVGLIDEGTSVLAGALADPVRLAAGDVVLIPAGQVHACNPDGMRWRYQMLHMDQGWAVSLAPELATSHLFTGISVLRRPGLYREFSAANAAIFADESAERIEADLGNLLRRLDAAAPERRVAGETDFELLARLRPVLQRLQCDDVNPALGELAGLVGMTRYQLVRAMKRATGFTPLAWRQNVRITRARRMLRAGHSVADTAHALGFTDQSHFHRIFRAHVATTPGAYRG